jgi:hypothetical protein
VLPVFWALFFVLVATSVPAARDAFGQRAH